MMKDIVRSKLSRRLRSLKWKIL